MLKGRRGARAVALKILYSMDIRNISPDEAIPAFWENFIERAKIISDEESELSLDPTSWDRPFMEFLVRGVWSHSKKLDKIIETVSENWKIYRMSIIDRNIIRMAVFEMLYCSEIPPKVSINEAIELGKIFGDKDSAAFINGILDKIYQSKEPVGSVL
ncbi:MAG: transcription antitermination factor NusB [Syntrophobacterales bacterium]|nr:transcription antitermination factor NusB [Syntrophobacterales bacterium]